MERLDDDLDVFQDFVGRADDLRAITRYSLYKVMFYRTNLYTHALRTAALTRAMSQVATTVFGVAYNPRRAEIMALIHDDAELVFGDVQAGNKSKMTPEQLAEVHKIEERAIDKVAKRFPKNVGPYTYKELLQEAVAHTSFESQVVCYADKYDALGEALHEVYAGNLHFTTNVTNEYGRIPTPPEYYATYFAQFPKEFPDMQPLLKTPLPIFEPIVSQDYSFVSARNHPYTPEDLYVPTGDVPYDTWRQIVLGNTNDEVVQGLHRQKEFLDF